MTAGTFAASDHTLLLNQGTISAAGEVFDLSLEPITVAGTGDGGNLGHLKRSSRRQRLRIQRSAHVAVEFSDSFLLTDVPVVNTVNVDFSGQGTIESFPDFTLTILEGDYNLDGGLDGIDLGLLEQAVDDGSNNLAFDANGDNVVDANDELFWLNDLRGALDADANLDDVVDGQDFIIWNANKFQTGTGWCTATLRRTAPPMVKDFVQWNANKFSAQGRVCCTGVKQRMVCSEPTATIRAAESPSLTGLSFDRPKEW